MRVVKIKKPVALKQTKTAQANTGAPTPLYILSDSTGNLARHMVTSFLTQFPAGAFEVVSKPFVNEPERFSPCLETIAARPGIVFHAVVDPALKQQIAQRCARLSIPCWDLTGSAVEFLASAARLQPHSDSERLHPVDNAYCGRINAMTYTLEHDDGLGLDGLAEADVVLVGVSRTGKTPTSILLAMQGYRAANVSLASGIEPPAQLFGMNPRKIIGLIIDPAQLAQIRTRRQTAWRMTPTQYNDPREVAREIEWSRRIFARLRCPVLDVTDQAIEETAARIVDMLGLPEPTRTGQGQELQ
jgi:regulator of PEP synthase PpsR (kinase-PPPase family)